MGLGVVVELQGPGQAALVDERLVDDGGDVVVGERLQPQQQAAREQRAR